MTSKILKIFIKKPGDDEGIWKWTKKRPFWRARTCKNRRFLWWTTVQDVEAIEKETKKRMINFLNLL